jgi:protein-S-isoprenylcysteine O-methyltransferase Ste14
VNAQTAAARAVAWAGAVLFAAALSYFLYSYSVTFGEIIVGPIDLRDIAVDVALFSAFALHHSIFARDPVRARVRRAVSAELERSAYVWVASLMLIAVCWLWRPVPGALWQVPRPWSWGATAIQLVAIWWTLRSAAVIDVWDLAGVRHVSTDVGRWEFRTDGPYGRVRHPIYLGWILLVFSVGTMTMTRFVFAVVSTLYLVIAIPFEERTLRRHAGGAYEGYMRQVRWRLIPRVY